MANRGQLTKDIKEKSKELLGYEIDQIELRFVPYIHYLMVSDQKIDPAKINSEERRILSKWKEQGHIEGGMTGLAITKEFWDFMNEVLWLGYVAYREE